MLGLSRTAVSLLAFSILTSAAPFISQRRHVPETTTTAQPAFSNDFADPSILEADGRFYAYATNHGATHVQVATSDDFRTWIPHPGLDALPNVPTWVNATHPNVWAPKAWQRKDRTFVLYYSATHIPIDIAPGTSRQTHCIGAATATDPLCPFIPTAGDALICPAAQGGAIDPSYFCDDAADGQGYVVYKVDGNSVGHGGVCGNSVAPLVSTPIMIQKVAADGLTLIGDAVQILDRDDSDGPLVEAPSIACRADGLYVLMYSSNCWNSAQYDVGYALAKSVQVPYVKMGVLLNTGAVGLQSPGGADLSDDATKAVFHGNFGEGRGMFAASMQLGSVNCSGGMAIQ